MRKVTFRIPEIFRSSHLSLGRLLSNYGGGDDGDGRWMVRSDGDKNCRDGNESLYVEVLN